MLPQHEFKPKMAVSPVDFDKRVVSDEHLHSEKRGEYVVEELLMWSIIER